MFKWKGVNTPARVIIDNEFISRIEELAMRASLWDAKNYGASL
jgi:hypothetical protein